MTDTNPTPANPASSADGVDELGLILLGVYRPHRNIQPDDYVFINDPKIQEAKTTIRKLIQAEVLRGRIDELENIEGINEAFETITMITGEQQTAEQRIAELQAELAAVGREHTDENGYKMTTWKR